MITKIHCVNITSKDPKALADFYRAIGAPVFVEDEDYDGWNLGNPENGGSICVWNENNWGTRKFTIADPDSNELGFC